jgi:hypothetical protein
MYVCICRAVSAVRYFGFDFNSLAGETNSRRGNSRPMFIFPFEVLSVILDGCMYVVYVAVLL